MIAQGDAMFSSNTNAQRILLIDDDASQIKVLHKVLKELGQVFFEQSGVKAFEQAVSVKPDVILLDIDMPDLNGYQVLELLKADEKTRDIPVIFITSFDSTEDQLRCLRGGAVDFISKPLVPELVAARVITQLRLKEKERTLIEVSQHARVTLESIGDAVITTDRECFVTYMNPAAELMIGTSANVAIGQSIEKVMPLRIGDNGPPHINPVRLAISEERKVGMALNCQMQKKSGQWISVEDSAAPLLSDDKQIMGAVIVFVDINESQAMALKMSQALQYDQLTNLPNRFLLMDKLSTEIIQSQRDDSRVGIILLDINRFKFINEEFGFEVGDILLKKIAARLKTQATDKETLSRHNADEFMILVPALSYQSELALLAMQYKECLMEYSLEHPELNGFTISMGLSIYPEDGADAQKLISSAHTALHKAKQDSSHQGICFHSYYMEQKFQSRSHLYMLAKRAITENNVIALYQPIVNAETHQLEAVEALMRLTDESDTLILPDMFIELAEETHLIIPLGEKMIEQVIGQLSEWLKGGAELRVCINISPVQFCAPNFTAFLLSVIENYGVPPQYIELEVTEGLMLRQNDQIIQDMVALREIGMTISIDDFGTGYSCLSYLKNLPVDVLKIDKSFVSELDGDEFNETLVTTIINLSQSMGFRSVAEGVETPEQAKRLAKLGVSMLQGYYFTKPISAKDLRESYLEA
ncbi:EAL domain-containing protein [Vibrio kanaloae]|nr:EAL domain-containing protein [Vibrio kanaloae]